MKRKLAFCVAALCLTMALAPSALAEEPAALSPSAQVCYPTSVSRSEDGTEIRKYYDLSPEDDPAGIPRSDFEQDGFRYTLIDLLKQELPENESRQHTETVSLQSKSKDMESVLALLPQEKEFITEDGLSGVLTLRLDTVQVEVAGYGSSTREVSATRSYPNLANQDTANIPLADRQHRHHRRICSGGSLHGCGHLHRHGHQQLCHRLYSYRGLRRHGQPDRSEQDPLCGNL